MIYPSARSSGATERSIRQSDRGAIWSGNVTYLWPHLEGHGRPVPTQAPAPPGSIARATEQTGKLLAALFTPDDIVEGRLLPPDDSGLPRSIWFNSGQFASRAEELVRSNNSWHVHFGVNPRRSAGERTDAAVTLARSLFTDFDHLTVDGARQRIQAAGLPMPSVIVNSGHGVHAYWRLTGAMADLPTWRDLQKDLAALLGGDGAAVNLERLLRLPGFTNHKPPAAPCELIECDGSRSYPFASIRKIVPVVVTPAASPPPAPPSPEQLASIPEDERSRRCGECMDRLPPSITGQRGHDALMRAACEIVRHGIPQDSDAGMALLRRFSERCSPPWSERDLVHKNAEAYKIAADEYGVRLIDGGRRSTLESRAKLRNDVGNGARFALQHGQDVRYNAYRKQWLRWNGKLWEPVVQQVIQELAKQTALAIFDEAKAETDSRVREEFSKHANASSQIDKLEKMMRSAQSDLLIPPAELDANPRLLNVQNGIVDLQTGTLRPHNRNAYFTRICRASYVPGTEAPVFIAFLLRTFRSQPAIVPYLQKAFGYAATGLTNEQAFFLLYGGGSNGKSTLMDAISFALGDYATKAPEGLLMARKNETHPTELADLDGARLVVSAETESGQRINAARVKDLTGEQTVKVRKMHGDFYSSIITYKFFVYTNNLPTVPDTSNGYFRRLHLVRFMETIAGGEKDADLPTKLRAEADGILTWIIQGAARWFREELGKPREVEVATEEYRLDADSLGAFLHEQCREDARAETPFRRFFDAYAYWCHDSGYEPESKKAVGNRLKDRGFASGSDQHNQRVYRGVALKNATVGGTQ